MKNDRLNYAMMYGQKGLWEEIEKEVSHLQRAKWRDVCRESDDTLENFYKEQAILACTVLNNIGLLFRPHWVPDHTPPEGWPELVYPLQIQLAGWIRDRGGPSYQYQLFPERFCLQHGFGQLPPYLVEGRSLELPVALYLLAMELKLPLSTTWGATGKLVEKKKGLVVQEVQQLDIKTRAFFREFPECRVILPCCDEAEQLCSQFPGQIVQVQTFSEAADQIFGKVTLEATIQALPDTPPFMLWKDLCNNYDTHHANPERALTQWEVAEKNRPPILDETATSFRTAAYVSYATHLGKDLTRVVTDIRPILDYFEGRKEIQDRLNGFWQIGTKLDAELDYCFLKNEVEQSDSLDKPSLEDFRRLGWWAMLVGKIQRTKSRQTDYFDKAAVFFDKAIQATKEPGRCAHTYNHYAELCLLRHQPDAAQSWLEESKNVFGGRSYDTDLRKQNEPYWHQLHLRIENARKHYPCVLQFDLRSKYHPSYMKGFLETEKLRAAVHENETLDLLEDRASNAQMLIQGERYQPLLNLLGLIPWMVLLPRLPKERQHQILRESLTTLDSFSHEVEELNQWRTATQQVLADKPDSPPTIVRLQQRFLKLMPYNY